ncbi:helix-turn-helix domain-containing protein [Paenibacillus dokdonensis]|uniref:helix-turn-helix domain-containing protein n=1 Tax=Paenibacillus dokdonensis TaxID=2567944 RepID=UPI001457B6AB|nr:helix-turn-helix domain-containing protein [Paenibacillus dokdonensis]
MRTLLLRKLPYKKRSFLLQIFVGLFFISFVIVSALSIIIFYWMKDKSLQEINKVNKMSLQNTEAVFSGYMKRFQNYAIELYENPDIQKLMFMNTLQWDTGTQNAVKHIRNILLVNRDMMNSVYILNDTGNILNISEKFSEPASERQLYRQVKELRPYESPVLWNMSDKYNGQKQKTMTFFFHKGTPESLGGAAAVNIDVDSLTRMILADENSNKHQKMFIANRMGEIIIHNDMSPYKQNISGDAFFAKITQAGAPYGTFTIDGQHGPVHYAYLATADDRYFIISEMDNLNALSDWVNTRNAIVMYAALMLLFSLVIAGFISYLLYRPFGTVVKNIRSSITEGGEQEKDISELQYVSNTFHRFADRIHRLKRENDTHTFAKMLRSGADYSQEEISDIFLNTGAVPSSGAPYAVWVVRIDNFESFSRTGNVETVSFRLDSLATIIHENLTSEAAGSVMLVVADQLVCIISEPWEGQGLGEDFLRKTAEKTGQYVSDMLNMDISIGISTIMNEPASVLDAYQEAYEVTRHRIVRGSRFISDASFLRTLQHGNIPDHTVKNILGAVAQGDLDKYVQELHRLASLSSAYPYESIIRFFAGLASSILMLSQDLPGEDTATAKISNYDIHKRVSEINDFDELTAWFKELYSQSSEVIREINHKKSQDFIPAAMEYINKNFCDASLSVQEVAGFLNISVSYFSKMFNESTAYTFPEYVNHLRMEKAKELIREYPELSITEISQKVGYRSNSYFTTSFKKKYGFSPSKIRQVHKI